MSKYTEQQRNAVFAKYNETRPSISNADTMNAIVASFDFIDNVNAARGMVTNKLAKEAGVEYQPDAKAATKTGVKRTQKVQIVGLIEALLDTKLPSLEKANKDELEKLRTVVAELVGNDLA